LIRDVDDDDDDDDDGEYHSMILHLEVNTAVGYC
jgi:hypothetical protein